LTCSVIDVSLRGTNLSTGATKISASDVGDGAVNANCLPSLANEKPPAMTSAGAVTPVIVPLV